MNKEKAMPSLALIFVTIHLIELGSRTDSVLLTIFLWTISLFWYKEWEKFTFK